MFLSRKDRKTKQNKTKKKKKKKKSKIEKTSLYYSNLSPNLAVWLTVSVSNSPYLEQISMDQKMYEPFLGTTVHLT